MANPIIRIHDTATNIVTDREMTDAEFEEYSAEMATINAKLQADADRQELKNTTIAKLGLTEDEAAALFG
jgi:hypothetical protein